MLRLNSIEAAKKAALVRAVVTLGVFDGVHVGHRYVIDQVIRLARERRGTAVVVTFAEHPKAIIDNRRPQLITSLPHRIRLFEQLGVDATLVLPFDARLRATEADDFAREVFHDAFHAEVVLLGFNGRFGKGGAGDFEALKRLGASLGFDARQAEAITLGGDRVSSTEIRRAILGGDLDRAARMLGRPVSILGTVIAGDGRGRTLGWPTANLDLHHEVRPPRGVYGCEVDFDGRRIMALCNVGVRPTFVAPERTPADPLAWEVRDSMEQIEVHLLDFKGDLYGHDLEVFFLTRLRDEKKFSGKDELIRQLEEDRRTFERSLGR